MDRLTVPGLLTAAAEEFGDRTFLRIGPVERSYAQARDAAAAMAGALAARGIGRGDRVAALLGNRVETVDLFLGCAWLGAVAVPLNTALHGRSLAHALREGEPQALYVEPELAHRAVAAGYRGTVWTRGLDAPTPAQGTPIEPASVGPEETAAVLFTSGTTGGARGVRCPQGQFVWWGRNVADALELTADDSLHTCLPLFHTNALNTLAHALTVGARCTLDGRFSASRYWSRATEAGATVVYLLGAMVPMLLAQPPGPTDRAHRVRCGLSPATTGPDWRRFGDRFGVTLVDGFGSTETNLVLGATPGEYRPGTLGTVRPGFQAQVLDAESVAVPDGAPGELVVRTEQPHAFATGYLGEPTEPPTGWRHTGDRVVRAADGTFRFVDRIKDVIRRRGENISSLEVESAVRGHPAVVEAAAFPVPSELAEDEVMVAVVARAGATVEPGELVRHCARELPVFAVPRYVEVLQGLPLTETGKVRKAALRERGVTAATWDSAAQPAE